MINPLTTRIVLPFNNVKLPPDVPQTKSYTTSYVDNFTSSVELNNAVQAEAKTSIIELLFGNIGKKQKTKHYEIFDASIYTKTHNKNELEEFFNTYQAPVKY